MGDLVAIRQPSMDEMLAFAEIAVRSKFYGFTSADQLLTLMIVAQSQGRPFASVVEEYSVIQGRPALKAEAMLARFQKAGGHIEYKEYTDERCAIIFSHPQCSPVEVDWDMDRARQAGLAGKGPWRSYPRAMLKARCISDGVRAAFPACLGGCYTPEEISDFEPTPAHVSPPTARGQLAAPEEPGQVETPREPSSSQPLSKADARDDFKALVEDMRSHNSGHDLKEWLRMDTVKRRIQLQPDSYKAELRHEARGLLDGHKQIDAAKAAADQGFEEEEQNYDR